jgi:hypothetical protein
LLLHAPSIAMQASASIAGVRRALFDMIPPSTECERWRPTGASLERAIIRR